MTENIQDKAPLKYSEALIIALIAGVLMFLVFPNDMAMGTVILTMCLSTLFILSPLKIKRLSTRIGWLGVASGLFLSLFTATLFVMDTTINAVPSAPFEIIHKEKESEFSQKTKELAWMEKSKDAARARLKDPKSAEFKNVYFSDTGGTPMTCGQVNSKNSLGGYTGYQLFVASGDTLAFFEKETDGFGKVWKKFCSK